MKLVTHARCVINVVREDEGWHGFCRGIDGIKALYITETK